MVEILSEADLNEVVLDLIAVAALTSQGSCSANGLVYCRICRYLSEF